MNKLIFSLVALLFLSCQKEILVAPSESTRQTKEGLKTKLASLKIEQPKEIISLFDQLLVKDKRWQISFIHLRIKQHVDQFIKRHGDYRKHDALKLKLEKELTDLITTIDPSLKNMKDLICPVFDCEVPTEIKYHLLDVYAASEFMGQRVYGIEQYDQISYSIEDDSGFHLSHFIKLSDVPGNWEDRISSFKMRKGIIQSMIVTFFSDDYESASVSYLIEGTHQNTLQVSDLSTDFYEDAPGMTLDNSFSNCAIFLRSTY